MSKQDQFCSGEFSEGFFCLRCYRNNKDRWINDDNWGLFLQFPKYSFELSLKGCFYKYPNIRLSDKIWKNTQELSSIILHQIA